MQGYTYPGSHQQNGGEEKQPPFFRRLVKHRAFIPILIFIGVVLIFSFSSQFSEQPPVIKSIVPQIGVPGEVLVIQGESFGEVRKSGDVSIAGVRPVSSAYIEWSDERISVRIPQEAGSGLVTVKTRTGRSNGMLFTNKEHIPVVLEGHIDPGAPFIEELSPEKGSVGTQITITGMNFGRDRGMGRVQFSALRPHSGSGTSYEAETGEKSVVVAARENEGDYISWQENEIKVHVPDGATSGSVYVETDKGKSNQVYFEAVEPVGTKLLTAKRGYQVRFEVEVENLIGSETNWIYLWVPKIYNGVMQSNLEILSEPKPYWDYSPEVSVYYLEDLAIGTKHQVSQMFWFDRYSVETRIDPADVVPYNTDRKLYVKFTAEDFNVPAGNEKIEKTVKEVVKWEKNPYLAAKKIYSYLLETYSFREGLVYRNPLGQMEDSSIDAYGYSILFCALLRNAGIPARPLSGYVVYGDKEVQPHFWAEFYLEKFGWVPVDPVLGDGVEYENFPFAENPEKFYFGNIDNHHILVSRGAVDTVQIKPDGKLVRRNDINPLQRTHEEVSPGIRTHNADWQHLKVIEWW
jgi:hypothetical protein